jgi:hypothetical protein
MRQTLYNKIQHHLVQETPTNGTESENLQLTFLWVNPFPVRLEKKWNHYMLSEPGLVYPCDLMDLHRPLQNCPGPSWWGGRSWNTQFWQLSYVMGYKFLGTCKLLWYRSNIKLWCCLFRFYFRWKTSRQEDWDCSTGTLLAKSHIVTKLLVWAGNTKGGSLYHWPPVWLLWNQQYDNWLFLFLFTEQTNTNQSNRRSTVQWYFPL